MRSLILIVVVQVATAATKLRVDANIGSPQIRADAKDVRDANPQRSVPRPIDVQDYMSQLKLHEIQNQKWFLSKVFNKVKNFVTNNPIVKNVVGMAAGALVNLIPAEFRQKVVDVLEKVENVLECAGSGEGGKCDVAGIDTKKVLKKCGGDKLQGLAEQAITMVQEVKKFLNVDGLREEDAKLAQKGFVSYKMIIEKIGGVLSNIGPLKKAVMMVPDGCAEAVGDAVPNTADIWGSLTGAAGAVVNDLPPTLGAFLDDLFDTISGRALDLREVRGFDDEVALKLYEHLEHEVSNGRMTDNAGFLDV